MGIYQPFLLAGGALSTIGAGLIYTFGMGTTLGPIIGYQIIYGAGVGIAVQVPILVAQALSSGEDQAMAASNVLSESNFSVSWWLRVVIHICANAVS